MVPLDICGVVLGSPYLYDHDAIFYMRENKYHLKKNGVEFTVRAHQDKNQLNSVVSNQMKQLISSNKRFVIMCVKEQTSCSSYESLFKDSLIKGIETSSVLFKGNKYLTHKQGIKHALQLMPKSPLPNVRMNQYSLSLKLNSCMDTDQYCGKLVFGFSCIFSPLEASFQVERKHFCFHIKSFLKEVSKYLAYASGESANQWKHQIVIS